MSDLLTKIKSCNDWLLRPLGKYILKLQHKWLQKTLTKADHINIAVIGPAHFINFMPLLASKYPHSQIVHISNETNIAATCPHICADFLALPVRNDSIDVVIVPTALNMVDKQLLFMREIYRILAPEGLVYLSSFNNVSCWGVAKLLLKYQANYPWNNNFTSFMYLHKLAHNSGFTFKSYDTKGYILPLNVKLLLLCQLWLDRIFFFPAPFGAIHFTVWQKKVLRMTMLTEKLFFTEVAYDMGVKS